MWKAAASGEDSVMVLSKRVKREDEGVSAVIGVILMVAITVAIAATVYIWVGGFGVGDAGDETASATASAASIDDTNDWIRVTLSSGENAPYSADDVRIEVLDANQRVETTVCNTPSQDASYPSCADEFTGEWEVGSSKYLPCSWAGSHQITVTVMNTVIMDSSINCSNASDTSLG